VISSIPGIPVGDLGRSFIGCFFRFAGVMKISLLGPFQEVGYKSLT